MKDIDLWIVIPNWDKFQHYQDRNPIWIKVYTHLPDHHEWQRLSMSDRGLLATAWLAYASSNGVLHVSRMVRLCGAHANAYGNLTKALKRLSDAGFVELRASKPLALARSREKSREEKNNRASTQPPKPAPTKALQNADAYQPTNTNNTTPEQLEELPALIADWLDSHTKPIQ